MDELGALIFIVIVGVLYFIPTIIAFSRSHAYKFVILGLNVAGFTGILWLISFVWAVWPSNKSLIDPVAGNVTGTGRRNVGDTLGSIQYGVNRGYEEERGESRSRDS